MNKRDWFLTGLLGGAGGILFAQGFTQFRREMNAAEERLADSMVVETAAGPIEFTESGTGPAVLLLHGAGGGCDQALFMARPMGQDFRWIAASRFGYQRTPLPADSSPAAQADAYASLLDSLGINKSAIVGLSAGGPSALQFALRYPDRCSALVMASAISRALPLEMPEIDLALKLAFRNDFLDYALIRISYSRLHYLMGLSPALRQRFSAADARWLSHFVSLMLPISWRRLGMLRDRQRLPALERMPLELITTPTLVLHAADDALAPLSQGQFTAATIPNAQLIVLKDGGHLMLTRHDEVLSHIKAFLQTYA